MLASQNSTTLQMEHVRAVPRHAPAAPADRSDYQRDAVLVVRKDRMEFKVGQGSPRKLPELAEEPLAPRLRAYKAAGRREGRIISPAINPQDTRVAAMASIDSGA